MAFLVFYMLDTQNTLITDDFITRPLLVVLMLLYPLTDTLRAFLIRSYKNQSPFVADRIHLHHRLADKGYQHWQASMLIFILSSFVLGLNMLLFGTLNLYGSIGVTLVVLILFYYIFFK